MEEYNACQQYKNRSEVLVGKLMPNAIPEKLWSHILADFITKLPLAQGYDAILVVCDWFSKIAYFIPTIEKTSVEELARLFRNYIQKLYRLPESIISNRGVQFATEIIRELNKLLRIQIKPSTAYYSQTDRQIERINQELEQYLRVFIDYRQEQWPEWLGTTEMGFKERKKGKFKIAEKFVEKIKKNLKRNKSSTGESTREDKKIYKQKTRRSRRIQIWGLDTIKYKGS